MKQNNILHIMILEKFLVPFIDFVDEYFGREGHYYVFITSEKYQFGLTPQHHVEFLHTDQDIFFTLLNYMKLAKKIILHGLWRDKVQLLLYFNQDILKKCYWIMWGGDFYFPEKQSSIKKQVIKNMGHLITYINGDYELARKWYGSKGKYHKCFTYPSNLYKEYDMKQKKYNTKNIQIGNSADPTNNHLEILEKLKVYKDENVRIFAPLSYGDKEYAKTVILKGKEYFEEKFVPLVDFMPLKNYLQFLGEIDIAIFAHKRQQAMGNTITLLGLGKKVYLDSSTVQWNFFNQHSIKIFNLKNINLEDLNENIKVHNKEKIRHSFSKEVLLDGLQRIFND